MQRIGIIGGGAWGTALAIVARRAGRDVVLWAHEPEVIAAVNGQHRNPFFLPDVGLDPAIAATADLAAVAAADVILLVAPAQFLRATCTRLAPHLGARKPVVICAKGIERETGALMTEVVGETLDASLMVLSGPTFAREVADGLPTAVTLGAVDADAGQ
jgi:glycerol-3-phosphate dehydrogenase (NAD(P)+)